MTRVGSQRHSKKYKKNHDAPIHERQVYCDSAALLEAVYFP